MANFKLRQTGEQIQRDLDKIENDALVKPASAPSATSILAIDSTNAQTMLTVGGGLNVKNGALNVTEGTSITVSNVSESTEDGGNNVVTFSDGKTLTVKNGKTGSTGATGANGASVTVSSVSESTSDGGENIVTFSDGKILTVKNGSKGSQGVKGDKGDTGPQGPSGSDATVTAANIKNAIGYTPADQEEVTQLSVEKIDRPVSGVVGQVLSVKTVDENGKPTEFVCVYQTGGGGSSGGGEATVVENTFKVWGPNATAASEGDVVTELNSGYYDKNGNQITTGSFGCTVPLIEINEDATVYAYNLYDFEAGYAITFFDSSKAVISGVGGTGNTSTRITGNQTVPSGAKYVAVTLLKSDPSMYCQITTRETIVENPLNTQVAILQEDVKGLKTETAELKETVDSFNVDTETFNYSDLLAFTTKGYYDTNGNLLGTTSWRCSNYIPVSAGDKVTAKLTTYNTANAISYFDENKKYISGVVRDTWSWSTSLYPFNEIVTVPEGAYFMRISAFVPDYATEQSVSIKRSVVKGTKQKVDIINGRPLNVLILGDSYSEMGRWVESMKEVIDIKGLVNLGVSSATLKDKQADRTTYPYSSRPKTTEDSGNVNTLSSQIAWLKRLMAGTDLDSGESQIYVNESDYPDVIIIEGGMNDSPDSDEVVATYHDQFMTSKTAYYKLNSSAAVTQTTVWVKPSLDTIDRTCFAGAYRYLCEELLTLFPKAQIFITTASHMNYFTVNPNVRYGEIAKQQRMCADIMSYTVIDWHAEGNLNTMMIGLNGSGTQSDPYTPVGGNEYTTDLLHPNDEGAKRYGRLAGKVIAQRFLGFN